MNEIKHLTHSPDKEWKSSASIPDWCKATSCTGEAKEEQFNISASSSSPAPSLGNKLPEEESMLSEMADATFFLALPLFLLNIPHTDSTKLDMSQTANLPSVAAENKQ